MSAIEYANRFRLGALGDFTIHNFRLCVPFSDHVLELTARLNGELIAKNAKNDYLNDFSMMPSHGIVKVMGGEN